MTTIWTCTTNDLFRDARRIRSVRLRGAVEAVLDDGRVNADDTVSEGNASGDDWERIARESWCLALSSAEFSRDRHVVAWFAKRGVRA